MWGQRARALACGCPARAHTHSPRTLNSHTALIPIPLFLLQLGGGNFYGPSGVSFFTQTKTITSAWKPLEGAAAAASANSHMVMPTPGKQ